MFLQQLKLFLITKPRHYLKWLGSVESKLISGKGLIKNSDETPSVFLFSTHKCASTFLNQLLRDLALREGKKHVDLESYWATRPDERDLYYADNEFTTNLFKNKGYYFGVFRYGFRYFEANTESKTIVVLRDPRDILTSQYYSIAFSHPVLTKRFINKRRHALEVGIDQHVKDMSDRFFNTYTNYIHNYLDKRNVLLVRYEDMVSDFANELRRILDFINYSKSEEAIIYWSHNPPFLIDTENQFKHKRKVIPGDYKDKLKPDTIQYLNKKFKFILERLGYSIL